MRILMSFSRCPMAIARWKWVVILSFVLSYGVLESTGAVTLMSPVAQVAPGTAVSPPAPVDAVSPLEDKLPTFPGGSAALSEFMRNNIKFPEAAKGKNIQGMVIASFDVAEDGKVGAVTVLRSLDPDVDAEAVRMIRSMPKWEPGRQAGKAAKMSVTLPVRFQAFAQESLNPPAPLPTTRTTGVPNSTARTADQAVIVMPSFPGGQAELVAFIRKNLNYPADAQASKLQGRVILSLFVRLDGTIEARVAQSLSPSCDAEALRVVRLMPKYNPGTRNGKPAQLQILLPITFKYL